LAVHIRLSRKGAKKKPFYRIVAADSRKARDGKFLEILGTYNPVVKPAVVDLKEELLTNWLNEGAVASDTVKSLLRQVGFNEKYLTAKKGGDVSAVELKSTITERKKRTRHMKKAALLAEETSKAEKEAAVKAKEEAVAAAEAKKAEAAAAAEAKKAEAAAAAEAPAETDEGKKRLNVSDFIECSARPAT
jgi:small subunit ribosomal protein S16